MSDFIAIILGASAWPRSKRLPASETFKNAAEDLQRYLVAPDGLAIESSNLLSLFDDPRSVDDIDNAIDTFLADSTQRLGHEPKNVIIYYTGHGAFVEGDNRYCLTLRNSRLDSLSTSAYRMSALARRLNRQIPNARRFVILDACFAASALPDFIPQSDAATRMQDETIDVLAESGTALLCAASSADVALTPANGKYTMFSGAILDALNSGSKEFGPTLSFENLGSLVEKNIKAQFRDLAVRPEIHIPDQRRGSIAKVALFPNAALRTEDLRSRVDRIERRFEDLFDRRFSQLSIAIASIEKRLHVGVSENREDDELNTVSSEPSDFDLRLERSRIRELQFQGRITTAIIFFLCAVLLIAPLIVLNALRYDNSLGRQLVLVFGPLCQFMAYGYLLLVGLRGAGHQLIEAYSMSIASLLLEDERIAKFISSRSARVLGINVPKNIASLFGAIFLALAIATTIWLIVVFGMA